MNFKAVIHLLSFVTMIFGATMAATAGVSWAMGDPAPAWHGMMYSALSNILVGLLVWATTRGTFELSRREGIGIVVFGWFFAAVSGAVPFLLCGAMDNPFDALFESVSGLTTTGASVMSNLESHSRGILLWRAILHLLGGMGILVLVVAIIPFLGVGGMQIFNAEATGPSKDRLTPRIASTAKLLWGVYMLMNGVLILLLRFAGMDWYDATCHAFAAISTGGFSTRSAGVAAFESSWIEGILILFMFLSGTNFALHYRALRGKGRVYLDDAEFRFFASVCAIALILVAGSLIHQGIYAPLTALHHAAFYAAFYVVSIVTCTGFTTVDYNEWPVFAKTVLVFLFLAGGCAGSTSGGIKQMRILILLKKMTREIRTFLRPTAIYPVKLGHQIIPHEIILPVCIFFFVYLTSLGIGTLLVSLSGVDQATAFSSVLTCLANVGPGFSTVGPVSNFGHLSDVSKAILSGVMLLGRLEFYTMLVIFMPTFWRK